MKMRKDNEKNGSQRLLPTGRNQSFDYRCLYLLRSIRQRNIQLSA